LSKGIKELLIVHLSCPTATNASSEEVKGSLEGYTQIPNPWKGISEFAISRTMRDIAEKRVEDLTEQLIELESDIIEGSSETKLPGWGLESTHHPIFLMIKDIGDEIESHFELLGSGEDIIKYPILPVMEVDFIRNLLSGKKTVKQWQDAKSRKLKLTATYSKDLHLGSRELQVALDKSQKHHS
jgi:hypothetical protein